MLCLFFIVITIIKIVKFERVDLTVTPNVVPILMHF